MERVAIKRNKGKYDMIKHERSDQTETNIEVEKPELQKRYQEIIEKKKKRRHKKSRSASRK